jgi:hypothetical protein
VDDRLEHLDDGESPPPPVSRAELPRMQRANSAIPSLTVSIGSTGTSCR